MDLAVHDHRIDRAPDIVDRAVANQLDRAGLRIDFDLADMATIGKGGEVHGLVALRAEFPAQLIGEVAALDRGAGHREDPDRAVGALHAELAAGELEIGRRGLQHMAGDAQPLFDDLGRRVQHDDAAEPQSAPGMRPAAD